MDNFMFVLGGITRLILEIFIVGGTGLLGFVFTMYILKKLKNTVNSIKLALKRD